MSAGRPERIHHLRSLDDAPSGTVRSPDRPTDSVEPNGSAVHATPSLEISNAVVGMLRHAAGRGPTKAKTVISADLALITLRECLTPAETTLVSMGEAESMKQARAALHRAIQDEATAVVERVTGRRVIAYLSDQQCAPDIAVIAFVFAAETVGGP